MITQKEKENVIETLEKMKKDYRTEDGTSIHFTREWNALVKAIYELKKEAKIEELACTNESQFHEVDQFICSNCGIKLEGWSRIEYDEETEEKECYETSFKFCPNCGSKIESEVK